MYFFITEISVSLEFAVDSKLKDVINFIVSCSVADPVIRRGHKKSTFQQPSNSVHYFAPHLVKIVVIKVL